MLGASGERRVGGSLRITDPRPETQEGGLSNPTRSMFSRHFSTSPISPFPVFLLFPGNLATASTYPLLPEEVTVALCSLCS